MTMQTTLDEVADGIYRISTFVPEIAAPAGFTYNQFLIDAEEPLLFHCGHRQLFPSVSEKVAQIIPIESLRWVALGHLEADESGSMNNWLAAAPHSEVIHGEVGCRVSINDLADRPPRALHDGEMLDLGGKRIRHIDTPHVPHAWDARVLFEEVTGTLLCGDLFAHVGGGVAVTDRDIVESARAADDSFGFSCLTPTTAPTIRRLAALSPRTLAIMHGSSFSGDCVAALHSLADGYDQKLAEALSRRSSLPPPLGAGCPSLD